MPEFVIPEQDIREEAAKDGITHLSTGIAVILNNKVLAVRRAPDDFLGGKYELPGGGIDTGEKIHGSVERELREETGLQLRRITGMFPSFEYETPTKPNVRQLNFLVETVDANIVLSPEHDEYQWLDESDIDSISSTPLMVTCLRNALLAAKAIG